MNLKQCGSISWLAEFVQQAKGSVQCCNNNALCLNVPLSERRYEIPILCSLDVSWRKEQIAGCLDQATPRQQVSPNVPCLSLERSQQNGPKAAPIPRRQRNLSNFITASAIGFTTAFCSTMSILSTIFKAYSVCVVVWSLTDKTHRRQPAKTRLTCSGLGSRKLSSCLLNFVVLSVSETKVDKLIISMSRKDLKHSSMDWKIPWSSWENLWFPVDFPMKSQPIDLFCSKFLTHSKIGSFDRPKAFSSAAAALRGCSFGWFLWICWAVEPWDLQQTCI